MGMVKQPAAIEGYKHVQWLKSHSFESQHISSVKQMAELLLTARMRGCGEQQGRNVF